MALKQRQIDFPTFYNKIRKDFSFGTLIFKSNQSFSDGSYTTENLQSHSLSSQWRNMKRFANHSSPFIISFFMTLLAPSHSQWSLNWKINHMSLWPSLQIWSSSKKDFGLGFEYFFVTFWPNFSKSSVMQFSNRFCIAKPTILQNIQVVHFFQM